LKKIGQLALVSGLEKAIWNWVENSPDEFARLQRQPSPELSGIHFMLLTDWACQTGTFLVYMLQNIDRI